jgi:hypothetical protein
VLRRWAKDRSGEGNILIYWDNYAFVGAIIIGYQFYRGPVPHSQITPTPIGAALE